VSTTNNAIIAGLTNINPPMLYDNLYAGVTLAQATALRLLSSVNRITQSPATGSAVLPSILYNEAQFPVFVINDSPQTILVGAQAGEKVNGVATTTNYGAGTLSLATGTTGVFFPVPAMFKNQGGALGGTLDWRAAVIS
jgi:hypothetical protein